MDVLKMVLLTPFMDAFSEELQKIEQKHGNEEWHADEDFRWQLRQTLLSALGGISDDDAWKLSSKDYENALRTLIQDCGAPEALKQIEALE